MTLSPEEMIDLQVTADPSADALIDRVAATGIIGELNRSLAGWERNDAEPPDDLPDFVREWLRESAVLPEWADPAVLARAHQLFLDHGPMIGLVGLTSSFAWMYACPHGAEVMARSGRFKELTSRRIAETIQYIFSVAETGAFTPQGRGITMSAKVRLIHATVRWSMRQQGYRGEEGRAPISQLHVISTALSLGPKLIDDLGKLGVVVTAEEADAWAHLWRICGVLLGGEEAHLPVGHRAGLAQVNAVLDREKGESEAGRMLTRQLLRFFTEALPGSAFDGIPAAVIRFLLDDERCRMLDIPTSRWESLFRSGWSGGVWRMTKALPFLSRSAVERLALALIESHFRTVDGVPVRIAIAIDVRTEFQRRAHSVITAYEEALVDGEVSDEERATMAMLQAQLELSDADLGRMAVVGAVHAALRDGVVVPAEAALIDEYARRAGVDAARRGEFARALADGALDARERAWLSELLQLVG